MKLEGLVAGIPDLFIPEWLLWVEMKREKGGSVSKEQKEIHKTLIEAGYTVAVCKGWIDAINQTREHYKKFQLDQPRKVGLF